MRILILLIFLQSFVLFGQKTVRLANKELLSFPLSDSLKESSGLIVWNALLWSHNDDNDSQIYGFQLPITHIKQRITFEQLKVEDWEEIQQDNHFFYVGDFGNNASGNRSNLRIFKINKETKVIDTIRFSYPEQQTFEKLKSNTSNFDCEAFVVHDSTISLFTKEWNSQHTSLYQLSTHPGEQKAQLVGQLKTNALITGAALHPTLPLVVLTAYTKLLQPRLILLFDFKGNNYTSSKNLKIKIQHPFLQIEAVAFLNEHQIAITNEAFQFSFKKQEQKIHLIDLQKFLQSLEQ